MGIVSRIVLSLAAVVAAASSSEATEPFQTTLRGKKVYCAITSDGSVRSGKLKNGVFVGDPLTKAIKRKVKQAKRQGKDAKVRKLQKSLKQNRSRQKSCVDEHRERESNPGPPPSTREERFAAALQVLKVHCATCHLNAHSNWGTLSTEDEWLSAMTAGGAPLINVSDLAASPLLARMSLSGGPSATMPLPNPNASAPFAAGHYELLKAWILGILEGEPPPPPPGPDLREGNELSSAELFACSGTPKPSKPRLRRIGNQEWAATLGRRGSDAEFNPLVPDPNHQYSTFSKGESLGDTVLSEYMNYVSHSRYGWIDGSSSSNVPRPPEHACMIKVAPPTSQCIHNFLQVYLRNFVLFRAPEESELQRLQAFAEAAVAAGNRDTQAERSKVMTKITSAAWLMSSALFRPEIGQGAVLPDGSRRLSDEELGLAIAYTFTNTGPGNPSRMDLARVYPPLPRVQAIENAVLDGTISTPARLDELVELNFAWVDPTRDSHYSEFAMGEKLEQFFIEWLGLEELSTSFHDTPSSTADVSYYQHVDMSFNHMKKTAYYGDEITLTEQATEMIARIVENDTDVLKTLLTSRDFYVPSNLESNFNSTASPHAVYNVQRDIQPTREDRWNTLPTNERAGVLTHPAWLAAHSDNFENGPSAVLRGKWVRENLLCGMVPDIPINVDASFPPSTAHLSARERLQLSTSGPECQTCHALMNPLGLPFEIYNHAGFLRATDHGAAPSGQSTIVYSGDPSLDGPVANAIEFSSRLAESSLVEECFVRQVFRYFMGRLEGIDDACTLSLMRETYAQSGGSMKQMVQALVKSPAFLERSPPQVEDE